MAVDYHGTSRVGAFPKLGTAPVQTPARVQSHQSSLSDQLVLRSVNCSWRMQVTCYPMLCAVGIRAQFQSDVGLLEVVRVQVCAASPALALDQSAQSRPISLNHEQSLLQDFP